MILYLETSDLVKLYVQESNSDRILRLATEAEAVATSIVAYAEARAAFARKYREKGIAGEDYKLIKRDLDRDWERLFVIKLTNALVKSAGNLAEKWGLRGFNALHLGSALELRRNIQVPIVFSSSDVRLSESAKGEGLEARSG
jgi:predicted nucleic acid-binding protein